MTHCPRERRPGNCSSPNATRGPFRWLCARCRRGGGELQVARMEEGFLVQRMREHTGFQAVDDNGAGRAIVPKGLPVFIRCHVGSPGNDGFGPRHSLRRVERPAAFDQLFRRCNGTRLDAGAEVFEKVPEVFSLDSLRHEPPPQGTPGSTAPRLRIPRPTRRRTVRRWRSRSRRRKAHRSPFPE